MDHLSTDRRCPVCKIDSFLNPNIKLYISPCFHEICEECLTRIFDMGASPCVECGTILRKINFISSTFEDIKIEREIKIRREVQLRFNKPTKHKDRQILNDWLEELENYIFQLLDYSSDVEIFKQISIDAKDKEHILNQFSTNQDDTEDASLIESSCKTKKQKQEIFGIRDCRNRFIKIDIDIPSNLFKIKNEDEEILTKDIFLEFCKFQYNKI